MNSHAQFAYTATDVTDAIFSSMRLGHNQQKFAEYMQDDARETVQLLLNSIDDGLKTAGLSFAEYLERLRQAHNRAAIHEMRSHPRWRFSARERAVQRVDSAVAHLCSLMQQQ